MPPVAVTIVSPSSGPAPGITARSLSAPEVSKARDQLRGHTVWHVNTTATGGGIAELLANSITHHLAAGISASWLVASADEAFFNVTKQLHHLLLGNAGPGQALGEAERRRYAETTRAQAEAVLDQARPGDITVLHDPQPLGMAPVLAAAGVRVIWRNHIGTVQWSPHVEAAWDFLAPFLDAPVRYVFSSPRYVPPFLPAARTQVIRPSIDPGSVKCLPMTRGDVNGVLAAIGLSGPRRERQPDSAGSPFHEHAYALQDQYLPADAPVVIQISRWDPLKDMAGVLDAFAEHIAPFSPAHLVLAGPDPQDIPDDPENARVLQHVLSRYESLAAGPRSRVHLVVLGLRDLRLNAVIVNALQRRATVIAQKSFQEGFGLAVTEAMWKRRPVVASAVGGIAEQITHGRHGLLIEDPADLPAFGRSVLALLRDPALRTRLTRAARERCRTRFLADRELTDYARLYVSLDE